MKLSTSEGISIILQNEYEWNDYFNLYFRKTYPYHVPRNHQGGLYENTFFYLITDYFNGELLCDTSGDANSLSIYIENIILLSDLIQQMPGIKFSTFQNGIGNFKQRFTNKVNKWFNDVPGDICKKFNLDILLEIVEEGINALGARPRHGDFTPWHIIKLGDAGLGLIDGEHALPDGVEGYDICYFIQRVFSILKSPLIAQKIYAKLLVRGYEKNKLKTILAARAIGGFLDESLKYKPDYEYSGKFRDWVIKV